MALPTDYPSLVDGLCINGHSIETYGYYKEDKRKGSLVRYCRTCELGYRMKYKYGLTLDEYDAMFLEQDFRCLICGKIFANDSLKDKPFVDHDHSCCPGPKSCGKCVRGILCMRCNTLLGLVEDNPDILLSAINFLGGV